MNKDYYELSKYCLNCVNKPCTRGCPLGNDIPGFIKLVKEEKLEESFKLLSETTVLSSLCGRICPHSSQCQGSCIRGIKGKPVSIGELEAYVGDLAIKNNWTYKKKKRTGKKVAVVGGGPSGLTCAAFLRRNGIDVTIYEASDCLGGLLSNGIPDFRLPKDIVKATIDKIIDLGIEVKLNCYIREEFNIEKLKSEYDAVFIGTGATISNKLEIAGENLQNVCSANDFLIFSKYVNFCDKTVMVYGGGNVAMDVSRTIKRLGAKKVVVIYRRSEIEMPAEKKEIEDAKSEGVEFLFKTSIVKIIGDKEVSKLELVKNELIDNGEGRLSPKPIDDSNYIVDCDFLYNAIGSHADLEFIKKMGLEISDKKRIKVDEVGRTSDEKVFSGGDIAGVKGTVAAAARSGRDAAYAIIDYLKK